MAMFHLYFKNRYDHFRLKMLNTDVKKKLILL